MVYGESREWAMDPRGSIWEGSHSGVHHITEYTSCMAQSVCCCCVSLRYITGWVYRIVQDPVINIRQDCRNPDKCWVKDHVNI